MKSLTLIVLFFAVQASAFNANLATEMSVILTNTEVQQFINFDDLGFFKGIQYVTQTQCPQGNGFSREYKLVLNSSSPVSQFRKCSYKVTLDNCQQPNKVILDKTPVCK